MSRIRLCRYLLAGISCWLFLSGCVSVDVETRAGRDLSGRRTYRITLEPMLARLYRSGASAQVFDFPGQALEKRKGIVAVSKKESPRDDGALELLWDYKARRLDDFSGERDTVAFSKRQDGFWIYYSYYEHHLPRKDSSDLPSPGDTWFKNSLVMPGQIYSGNGDSLSGSRMVWLCSMDAAAREGLVMKAESREINPLLLVLLPAVLGLVTYILLRRRLRQAGPAACDKA